MDTPQINRHQFYHALTHFRAARLTRREALALVGALGVTATSAGLAAGHPSHDEATPAATPELGYQPDGTHVWRVTVGGFDPDSRIDAHAFFPSEITGNAGDTIFFDFGHGGFHTVSFLGGEELPPLLIPDETAETANGESPLLLNPAVAYPTGGDQVGEGYVNSGIDMLRDPDAPFSLTFPTPGTYDYVCLPHAAVMTGRVIVQESDNVYPTPYPMQQDEYDALAEEQLAALIEEGQAEADTYAEAIATPADNGTTIWEVTAGAGPGQARVMRFLPQELEIKAGDTVRWVNRSPGELHTVTFLGDPGLPEEFVSEPQEDGPPKLVMNPEWFAPEGDSVHRGTGFVGSGAFGEPFGPATYELTFEQPGTFDYVCVPHVPMGMAGTVTVTEG